MLDDAVVATGAEEELVATGVQVVQYIPSNGYLVYGDAPSLVQLQKLSTAPHVSWVSPFANDYKLHPAVLKAAAASFCKDCSNLLKVDIDFHAENIPKDLSSEISLCLYRVLQEALQNATKHSGARHFKVSLTGRANKIELRVQDSGIGFKPDDAIRGRGIGLSSMQERLKLVHGQLFIESKVNQGTTFWS